MSKTDEFWKLPLHQFCPATDDTWPKSRSRFYVPCTSQGPTSYSRALSRSGRLQDDSKGSALHYVSMTPYLFAFSFNGLDNGLSIFFVPSRSSPGFDKHLRFPREVFYDDSHHATHDTLPITILDSHWMLQRSSILALIRHTVQARAIVFATSWQPSGAPCISARLSLQLFSTIA